MDGQLGRGLDGRDEFLRRDPREGQHSQSGGSSSVFEQIYTRLPLLSCQMFSPMMNDDSKIVVCGVVMFLGAHIYIDHYKFQRVYYDIRAAPAYFFFCCATMRESKLRTLPEAYLGTQAKE